MSGLKHPSRAFTLIELVVSMSILTILVSGMASAVFIASYALPGEQDLAVPQEAAGNAAERIKSELMVATSFNAASANAVDFMVPDRGHGAPGSEWVRFNWSGSAGDPLTVSYNGSPAITLCSDVHNFVISYEKTVAALTRLPRVLLVVNNDASLTTEETARRQAIESWGFSVDPVRSTVTEADLDEAAANADVVYVPLGADRTIAPLLLNLPLGVVVEDPWIAEDLGLAKVALWYWSDTISLVNYPHEITSTLSPGSFVILGSPGNLLTLTTPAPGGSALATLSGKTSMLAVEIGAELYLLGSAKGRRTCMPWGDSPFSFGNIIGDGQTLMHRAIVWAAAPAVVSGIEVTVQVGPAPTGSAVSRAQMLNMPEVP